jgi:serine/threonine protein kinase/lipoprotein NlpI
MLLQSTLCCLNPDCPSPINPASHIHCQSCGVPLVGLLYSRFKVIKPIGRGGFGKTYLAEDVDNLNGRCVVKQLAYQGQSSWATRKAVELFEQEARQLALLSENHQIPKLLAYFQDSNHLYLAQQFIEGEDLLKQLEHQGPYSEGQVKQLLLELLPVLQFTHDRDVIHRDIKPENIMQQTKDGKLFLIDFGVSKLISPTITGTGSILGSHGYSPLEQIQQGKVVYASDLFALGVTCFHLLSGIHPQQLWTERGYDWVNNWQRYLPTPVTAPLDSVLDKLLQKDIENRYQSANEVLKDLRSPTSSTVPTSPLLPKSPATVLNLPSPPPNASLGASVGARKRWFKKPAILISTGVAAIAAVGLAIGIPYLLPNRHATIPEVVELYKLANEKFSKGNKQQALEDFNKAIALDPNFANGYIDRGNARDALGDKQGAIADYTRAIELDSRYADAYINRGNIRNGLGDRQGANADYSKAIEANPGYALAYYNRGIVRDDREGAIADYSKAIELDPNYVNAYYNRAFVRDGLNDKQGAIADYSKVIELNPKYSNAYLNRGNARSILGDLQGAIADHNKAIETNPKNVPAYNARSQVRLSLRDTKGAFEDLTKAIELDPKNIFAYANRLDIRNFHLNDFQGALEDSNKLIELDRTSAIGYLGRGTAYLKLEKLDKALEDLNKAIAIKPDLYVSYLNRSIVRISLEDFQGAVEDSTKVIELAPKLPVGYLNRGVSRNVLGDYKAAIEDFTKAIELKPDLNQAYTGRGQARAALGDKKGAIEDYQKSAGLYLNAGRTKDYQDALNRVKQLKQ